MVYETMRYAKAAVPRPHHSSSTAAFQRAGRVAAVDTRQSKRPSRRVVFPVHMPCSVTDGRTGSKPQAPPCLSYLPSADRYPPVPPLPDCCRDCHNTKLSRRQRTSRLELKSCSTEASSRAALGTTTAASVALALRSTSG